MTCAAQIKKLEALRKREERESKRVQRELAKRAKERQKLSELDAARLEVETFENELEVNPSIHKESPESFDWAALACALPPLAPRNPGRQAALHEIGSELGEWLDRRVVPDGESAMQADQLAMKTRWRGTGRVSRCLQTGIRGAPPAADDKPQRFGEQLKIIMTIK